MVKLFSLSIPLCLSLNLNTCVFLLLEYVAVYLYTVSFTKYLRLLTLQLLYFLRNQYKENMSRIVYVAGEK